MHYLMLLAISGVLALSNCLAQDFKLIDKTESKTVYSNSLEKIILFPNDSLFLYIKHLDEVSWCYVNCGVYSQQNDTISAQFSNSAFMQILQKHRNYLPTQLSFLTFGFNNYSFLQKSTNEIQLISTEVGADLNARMPKIDKEVYAHVFSAIEVDDLNQIILPEDCYIVDIDTSEDNLYNIRVLNSTHYSYYKNFYKSVVNSKGYLPKNSIIGEKICLTDKVDYVIREF